MGNKKKPQRKGEQMMLRLDSTLREKLQAYANTHTEGNMSLALRNLIRTLPDPA